MSLGFFMSRPSLLLCDMMSWWQISACIEYDSIFFREKNDFNLFQTFYKYVAGHLIRTSLAFSLMTLWSLFCEIWCLNDKYQLALHMIQCFWEIYWWQSVSNSNKYVAGRLIKMSLWLVHGLVICNMTAKSTKFTKDFYNALSLVI